MGLLDIVGSDQHLPLSRLDRAPQGGFGTPADRPGRLTRH